MSDIQFSTCCADALLLADAVFISDIDDISNDPKSDSQAPGDHGVGVSVRQIDEIDLPNIYNGPTGDSYLNIMTEDVEVSDDSCVGGPDTCVYGGNLAGVNSAVAPEAVVTGPSRVRQVYCDPAIDTCSYGPSSVTNQEAPEAVVAGPAQVRQVYCDPADYTCSYGPDSSVNSQMAPEAVATEAVKVRQANCTPVDDLCEFGPNIGVVNREAPEAVVTGVSQARQVYCDPAGDTCAYGLDSGVNSQMDVVIRAT